MKPSKPLAATLLACFAAALLSACGGGSGGGGGGGGTIADINGTGYARGAVQRFGSIFVNGREFDTSSATFVIDDEMDGTQADLAVGNVVEIEAIFNEDGSAIAQEVRFDAELEGPVASIDRANNSFTVAGQTVLVSATTVYEDTSFETLAVNDVVEVSGKIDVDGKLRASSVELKQAPDDTVEVKGTVQNLNPATQTFMINDLTVNYSGAVLDPVDFTLENGQFVEAEGSLVGGTLTATELELEDRVPVEEGDAVEIEGIVATVTGSGFTLVSGQVVAYDGSTIFEQGNAAEIQPGAEVEVAGNIDAGGVLQALKIELEERDADIEIAALVSAVNRDTDTITLLGLNVQATNETRIKDDRDDITEPVSVDDIQVGDFVEIGAFDRNGALVATRIEREEAETGQPEVELQARLDSEDEAGNMLVIRGVTILINDDTEFEDASDNPIDKSQFFAQIDAGDLVEAAGAFNGNLITAREVSLEEGTPATP